MDVLADIFETIQLKGTFYFRTHFSAPWGTTIPPQSHAARFHYVVQGTCYIRVEQGQTTQLSQGDLVMIPNGASHILADAPGRDAPPLESVFQSVGYRGERLFAVGEGDPAAATQLICGHFTFGDGTGHAILRALPTLIKISAPQRAALTWFDEVLNLLVKQVFRNEPGAVAAITRLSEILFIEAVRFAGKESEELKRLLDAFADERIGRAIAVIHRDPARQWTVQLLAREAGMSRTRFADRFQELIGRGPASYLSEWRLQRAAVALRTTHRTIAEISYGCGYFNQAAFARAFKEQFGQSPKMFRKMADNSGSSRGGQGKKTVT
jgi:AraC family transcriptional regulator, activator of mtrCDE